MSETHVRKNPCEMSTPDPNKVSAFANPNETSTRKSLSERIAHANAARIRHLRRAHVDFLNLRRRRRAACRRLHRAKFIFLQIFARPRGVERLRRVVDRRKLEKRLRELRHPAFRLLRVVFLRQRRAG